ncbi:nicotinamide N-methyltransferase-like [Pseudophryne corroboree]|uniref:nicotinamide N-methyltransferase-like n=1 Tax=Pseudophryne corroboree TaxID=495146 RepID=UPI003081A4BF
MQQSGQKEVLLQQLLQRCAAAAAGVERGAAASMQREVLQQLGQREVIEQPWQREVLQKPEHIAGDTLIDISGGHCLFQLFPVCQYFKEIIILECKDQCIDELRKWKSKDPGAHDWSYAAKYVVELGDKSESYQDLEDMTQRKLKRIEMCNLAKENPTSPTELPKADCVISVRLLEAISEDLNAFCRNLKNMSSLLKVGGHLILIADVNTSFFAVGNDKYFMLCYDDGFLRKALADEGYLIKCYEAVKSEIPSDVSDIKKTVFVVAQKQ